MPLPALLQPVVTWVGRAMLVRFAVGTATLGAGAVAGSALSSSSGSGNGLFSGMAWGEVAGQGILDEAESHWNDNGMGNGEPCAGGGSLAPCVKPGSEQEYRTMWFSKGIWGYSEFRLNVFWDYDGCNITNLYFTHKVSVNSLRAQCAKYVIQKIRIEPTNEYEPDDCGCIPGNKPATPKKEEEIPSGPKDVKKEAPCCCSPAVIKIVVSFQILHRGAIWDEASSRNWTFIIAADGYGTSSSDAS